MFSNIYSFVICCSWIENQSTKNRVADLLKLNQLFSVSVSFIFSACPRGTFKASAGDAPCSPCPTHSYASIPGSRECGCQAHYYRASSDVSDAPCTSKYLRMRRIGLVWSCFLLYLGFFFWPGLCLLFFLQLLPWFLPCAFISSWSPLSLHFWGP